jgi:Fe-S cluster assembly ATP-binding protein
MLQICDLSVSIENKLVLQGLSLGIEPGTVHALMGPNGSGKSTLSATLMGHPRYAIHQGSIIFAGTDLTALTPDKRAQLGLFLAFQNPYEIPGVTVSSFLKESLQAIKGCPSSVAEFNQKLHHALALLNLDPAFAYRHLNDGFSGGEKKKLEIVQMLVLEPSCIVLDEIDSGLDIDALKAVGEAIAYARVRNPALSMLIITHYQRMLRYVEPDYVHILHAGRIVCSGGKELALRLEHEGYEKLCQ